MLWPTQLIKELSSAPLFEPDFNCAYAADATTTPNKGNGCYTTMSTCQELGISSAEDYVAYFGNSNLSRCGFLLGISREKDKVAFEATLELQESGVNNSGTTKYDEIIIAGWPTYAPEKIPLLGFFYMTHIKSNGEYGNIEYARNNQKAFYKQTNIFAPIIRVTGDSWENIQFKYIPEDQSPEIPETVNVIADIH